LAFHEVRRLLAAPQQPTIEMEVVVVRGIEIGAQCHAKKAA
jgi:hypothetical protein